MTKHFMRKIMQPQLAQIVQSILSRATSLPSLLDGFPLPIYRYNLPRYLVCSFIVLRTPTPRRNAAVPSSRSGFNYKVHRSDAELEKTAEQTTHAALIS
jgi:hypothetical protein